ncbi:MAG: hypothetical protein NC218_07600 [Acetobacter sp.]|nr:hypothetical protein [Acetobacter sp.]
MILGYLDKNEKNINVENQRQYIQQYAIKNNLTIERFVQETNIKTLISNLETTDYTLIIANIVSLGTSLQQIKENISQLGDLNLTLVSVKESYIWKPNDLHFMPKFLDLIISIRSSLTSIVTCKALSERKSQGIRLGRKTPNKQRVFDGKEDEIKQKLVAGITKKQIAKDLGVSQGHLYVFLRMHPEIKPDFKGDL